MNPTINPEIKSFMQLGMSRNLRFVSIKLGGGIIEMRGSMAGNVYSRNRGGNYMRAKTTPINPNSARQVVVRAALAFLTARWSDTLSAAQRTAWNLYASSVAMTNRLGETVYHSGFNHYIRSNTIKRMLALTLVDDGPVVFEVPEHDPTFAISVSEATQNITATYDATSAWADEDEGLLVMFQGSPQNAQRNFFAGPWRLWTAVQGVNGAPPASPKIAPAVFAVSEGQMQWMYARILREDGRISEPFRCDALIGA